MGSKAGNIKSLVFLEQAEILHLDKNSQPFIGDINGDQIDDILFNNQEDYSSKGRLNVAIYNQTSERYDISNFKDTLVDN